MKNILITLASIILIITCVLLKSVWTGFVYFALSILILISLYWILVLIFNYRETYKEDFEEEFKLYCAKLVNFSNVSLEEIEKNTNFYIKKFKKTLRKDKFIEWGKILFLACLIIASIVSMATVNF